MPYGEPAAQRHLGFYVRVWEKTLTACIDKQLEPSSSDSMVFPDKGSP